MSHLSFVDNTVDRGSIAEGAILNQGTVGSGILVDITLGEGNNGGKGIVLVRNSKIGIKGKSLATAGTLPAGEETENSINKLINNNLKVTSSGLMTFKPVPRCLAMGTRRKGTGNFASAHLIVVLLDVLNSDSTNSLNKRLESIGSLIIMRGGKPFFGDLSCGQGNNQAFWLNCQEVTKEGFLFAQIGGVWNQGMNTREMRVPGMLFVRCRQVFIQTLGGGLSQFFQNPACSRRGTRGIEIRLLTRGMPVNVGLMEQLL